MPSHLSTLDPQRAPMKHFWAAIVILSKVIGWLKNLCLPHVSRHVDLEEIGWMRLPQGLWQR